MHVDKTRILQLRGKQNKRPLPEYMRAIAPLTQRLRPSKIEFGALGFVVDTQGVRHELTNLPDGVDVDGGLVLNGSEITSLAKGMTVRGDLDLAGSMIDRLPEGLTVHGSLVLSDEISGISKIDQLPNDIVVHRKLDMRKTKITEIPSGARIGSIDATLSKLRKLPDGFSVDGDAKFGGTNITKLPARMYVGGDLGVWHTGLTEIPADLSCGGINCSSNPISVLPSGVVRDGGSVDVSETRIRSLPANLKAGYRLDISQTAIDALPTDVSGVRNLNASLSKLAKLPSGLRLDSLNITCTPISEIPPDLSASGSVWLAGTKVRKLPDNLDVFSLGLEGCDLATLPDNLRVRNNIYMNGSPIEFLPDGLVVEGDVEASGSRLAGIGANVTIGGNLMAARSRLKALPDDLRLGTIIAEEKRELDISGTKIAALPKWNVKFAIVNITKTPISEIPAGWTVGTVGARNSALREVAGQVDVLYHNTEGLNVTGRISSQVTSHPIVRAFSIALAAYKTALVIVGRDITQVCRLAAGVLRRGVGLGAHAEHS
jgi:hypothetical protein